MPKRIICTALSITILMLCVCGRIGYIAMGDEYAVAKSQNIYKLNIDSVLPTIYYRDMTRATNNIVKYAVVIRPNPKCIGELDKVFSKKEISEITDELQKGFPIIRVVDEKPITKLRYLLLFKIYNSNNDLNQLLNKTSNGIYNHINSDLRTKSISFSVDAAGRLLDGDMGTVESESYNSPEGYVISVDKKIQQITKDACSTMKQGCAIVMNVEDNSILACINKPDETYLIKAFSRYAVGSVFKLVVAACALEYDIDVEYNCTGSITVADTVFSCQNNHIHNTQNLKMALSNSCNCYFVNLANTLGAQKITETAEKLGFNDVTQLFDKWYIKNATMPTVDELESVGELSLFGFGQGKLAVSPIQICSFLCTVSNKGIKNYPRLFLKNINSGGFETKINYPVETRVLSENTCEKLIEYMRFVVTNGTGANAQGEAKKSAGKTATAQTGQYILNHEYLNTWFAGVYPCDNPRYAIVVMTEKGKSGSQDCCPIFRTIVDELEKI